MSSSTLLSDFFAEQALLATCILDNNSKIKTTALLDTKATRHFFIDLSIVRHVCDELHIEFIRLSKPKALWGFDGKQAPNVTHTIYPTMSILNPKKTTTPMLITKLSQHQIIFRKPKMKKREAVLDMQNDWLSFWPGHYQYDIALRLPTAEPQAKKPRDKKPCIEPSHAKKPHAEMPVTILKRPTNELPELLPYLLPSTQSVSKITNTSAPEKEAHSRRMSLALWFKS